MRFLVDNALSPRLAKALQMAGHDAVHVASIDMESASDGAIIAFAAGEGRVVITADADFSRILFLESRTSPSVLFLRGLLPRRADQLSDFILRRLGPCKSALERGAIVTITPERTRIRELPASPR